MKRSVPRMLSSPTLTKMPGGILDVVARRLDEPRHLTQLRQHAAGALGQRRVIEQRLTGEARGEHVGVMLRAAFPWPNLFEVEEPRADAGVERRPFEPLGVGQPSGIDGRQAARKPTEVADLRLDRLAAPVLEKVVVQVNAVEGGVGRMDFVKIRQVLVDEMRQGFG